MLNLRLVVLACLAFSICHADIYMHNPRGSNNRLNERSANRKNANRLFDSQNNNKGGYNVGDADDTPAGVEDENQYQMTYFQSGASASSYLTFEWTNQHGCGGKDGSDPHKLNCNIVIQYMCQSHDVEDKDRLRDGISTSSQRYRAPSANENVRRLLRRYRTTENRGLHEPWWNYELCYVRERNKGLFTADQELEENKFDVSSAIFTRQNAAGTRRGFECPEERDYYPYWHPTSWTDIAVLTDQTEHCDKYRQGSFNVRGYNQCFNGDGEWWPQQWNNEQDCTENGGLWATLHSYIDQTDDSEEECVAKGYVFGLPYDAISVNDKRCLIPPPEPECLQAPWSRVNHHGNSRDPLMFNYTWTLPHFPSGEEKVCVTRMRYNISTDDYNPLTTDASSNGENSPIENNPTVDVGGTSDLNIAFNTAQTGRTFQDRSHTFLLAPRPQGLEEAVIYNLNVRGKRGNLVQTYPSVEYDFTPTLLSITERDLVHIQWTGSNTHNNGNPAGDGQAGSAGNGKAGTDRSNFVELASAGVNFPLPEHSMSMIREATVHWSSLGPVNRGWRDVALELATSGYYVCASKNDCPNHDGHTVDSRAALDSELDNAPASYPGIVLSFKAGTYHYASTRNNDFSNRSQKAKLIVK